MKSLLLIFSLLICVTASTYQAIDLSPLQLQYRYEDTSAQSKESIPYRSLSASLQMDCFRVGFGYAEHDDSTGNASLAVRNEKKEYAADFGYQLFSAQGKNNNLRLDIFAEGVLGISQSQVATTLLSATTSSTSNNDLVYGLGAAAIGRYSYFLLETDFKYIGSKAFSPQYVPVLTVKAGVSFQLP